MNEIQKSRRDALKIFTLGSALAATSITIPTQAKAASDLSPNIAIIGAGLGGITMSAHLIDIMPKANVTLYDANQTMHYEPGFTLIAAGVYTTKDTKYDKADLIHEKVKWVKQNVQSVDPNNNSLTTNDGNIYKYDYLIISTGVYYDFQSVKGLNADIIEDPNSKITSIYTPNGATKANKFIQELVKNGGNALFAEPNTPSKCGGANKKVNMLLNDLGQKNNQKSLKTILCTGGANMLSSPLHAKMIEQIYIQRDMEYKTRHLLVEVDTINQIAKFDKLMPYTQDSIQKTAKERVEIPYDYLFVVPRMKSADFITQAGLNTSKGDVTGNWVDVDQYTLQHKKYPNIFALGDCAGVPKGKTGASIRKQYPVVGANILSHLKNEPLEAKFDGYTACPLLTRYGKAVMVEFNYKGAAPTLECMGSTRESWLNWAVKVYLMKPMVMQAMIHAKA